MKRSRPRSTSDPAARRGVLSGGDDRASPALPLRPNQTILEREIRQAVSELRRPALGLFLSGLLAGFGIGLSLLLAAVTLSRLAPTLPEGVTALLLGGAYATGFIVVIMGRTDLFTEYTTLAILPVLEGLVPIRQLGRLWGLVYTANLVGGIAVAGLVAVLGPRLGVVAPEAFGVLAERLTAHPWWVILLSGGLVGWLMGLLSWLVSAGRDTTSQILFIGLVTGGIALGHLHHSVVGAIEVMAALFAGASASTAEFGHFLLWATVGNALGGVLFAVLIQYSVVLGGGEPEGLRGASPDRSSPRGPR